MQNVSATRMTLLDMRRRVELAARGHRLLSEKRDEISRQLVQIAARIKPLREAVNQELQQAFKRFMLARAMMEPEDFKAALEVSDRKNALEVAFSRIMNVEVPHLTRKAEGDIIAYGFSYTSGELDVALTILERVMQRLVELAEIEKQARLLASELLRTRRRVNMLEHRVIPELRSTIRYIGDKLNEAERDNITRLMKIADIIRH